MISMRQAGEMSFEEFRSNVFQNPQTRFPAPTLQRQPWRLPPDRDNEMPLDDLALPPADDMSYESLLALDDGVEGR